MRRQSARTGFTVMELAITCAILATAFTLVLPAVQRARVQSRSSQCKNNFKIIGLALHNYYDTYNTFPPGWIRKTPYAQSPSAFGWQVSILPFVEQGQLFDELYGHMSYPFEAGAFDRPDRKLLEQPLAVFRCPADTTGEPNTMRGRWGTSNYSGNFGSDPIPRLLPLTGSMYWPGAESTPTSTPGLFSWNSSTRFRDIVDGSSNTFLVGERALSSSAGIWPGVRSNSAETDAVTDTSPGNEINSGPNAFSSQHKGGSHFVFCDGAVFFINEKIASRGTGAREAEGIYQNLGNRQDGHPARFLE
ncbi:MAG: DUF1559 domain-containing protein [Planctomycetaceae bacterium]|nr:DUF1559 domain-containing protein [Planctomycetaceae bacterium]